MKRDLYRRIGGWDKGFVSGQGENDIVMRGYELGCNVVTCKEAKVIVHHEDHNNNGRIRLDYHLHNRKHLLSLWTKNGKLLNKRTRVPNLFEDPISRTADQW
jgi:GT2 family glycosyltransferase